jgi:hypothetical protein
MKTIRFRIQKNTCRTTPQVIHGCKELMMPAFNSDIRDLAIVLEDHGSRSVYYTPTTQAGFKKLDPLEFGKVWLEYPYTHGEYEVKLLVG